MALILKTKGISLASLGNVSGNSGAQDYIAMLDFSRGEYYLKDGSIRTDLDISEAITVTRSGAAKYLDRLGKEQLAQSNQPRFEFDKVKKTYGIYIGDKATNLITNDANGSTVTLPAAGTSTLITLSWEGTGTVSLTSAVLTAGVQYLYSDGIKNIIRYTRTVTTVSTATLNVSGSVSKVQLEQDCPPSYDIGLGKVIGKDVVKLGTKIMEKIGSDATIIIKITYKDQDSGLLTTSNAIAIKNGLGQGGFYLTTRPSYSTSSTLSGYVSADNALLNAGVEKVSFTGTARKEMVAGLGFGGNGDIIDVVFNGLYKSSATGNTPISPVHDIFIGGEPNGFSGAMRAINGSVSHCIVYDRRLTESELAEMSTMWQS